MMEQRYAKMAKIGARGVEAFNERVKAALDKGEVLKPFSASRNVMIASASSSGSSSRRTSGSICRRPIFGFSDASS
jgi:hypothetical protein